jgi:hypothetical protein
MTAKSKILFVHQETCKLPRSILLNRPFTKTMFVSQVELAQQQISHKRLTARKYVETSKNPNNN